MRYLEVRRHTMRVKPGEHLSQEGVSLARNVGEGRGPFDLVVTSPAPRAYETAIAMGFAVHETIDALDSPYINVFTEVEWSAGFAAIARAVHEDGVTGAFAQQQAAIWREVVRRIPDEGRALIVTHGGFIEAGMAVLLSDESETWGPACDYVEGALLHFDGDACVGATALRLRDVTVSGVV